MTGCDDDDSRGIGPEGFGQEYLRPRMRNTGEMMVW